MALLLGVGPLLAPAWSSGVGNGGPGHAGNARVAAVVHPVLGIPVPIHRGLEDPLVHVHGPLRQHLRYDPAVEVAGAEPLLEDVLGEVEVLLLCLLPPLDHLQQRHRPREVPPQLEHLFVGGLVVLAVLPGLHLLRAAAEGDVGVAAAAAGRGGVAPAAAGAARGGRAGGAVPLVRFHSRDLFNKLNSNSEKRDV